MPAITPSDKSFTGIDIVVLSNMVVSVVTFSDEIDVYFIVIKYCNNPPITICFYVFYLPQIDILYCKSSLRLNQSKL